MDQKESNKAQKKDLEESSKPVMTELQKELARRRNSSQTPKISSHEPEEKQHSLPQHLQTPNVSLRPNNETRQLPQPLKVQVLPQPLSQGNISIQDQRHAQQFSQPPTHTILPTGFNVGANKRGQPAWKSIPHLQQPPVVETLPLNMDLPTVSVSRFEALQIEFELLLEKQEDKVLQNNFKNLFFTQQKERIEKLGNTISQFCQNPQNENYKEAVETQLLAICGIMRFILGDFFTKSGDAFALAACMVAQVMVSNIKNLDVRYIQPLFLLESSWKKESETDNLCLLKGIMPHLLDQIRNLFPLSHDQNNAYKKLNIDISKIIPKSAARELACEIADYFDNRLFYDLNKTLVLIAYLKDKGIEVPQCLYTYCTFQLHEIETRSKKMLKDCIHGKMHKYGYMLDHGYMNALVYEDVKSDCFIVKCSLFSVFKWNEIIPSKHLFFIPGHIQIVFEKTNSEYQFKEFKASNSVLQSLIAGKGIQCNESMLEAMVAQAKKEEPYESLCEWYAKQLKIILSKEFFDKYKGIFYCIDDCIKFRKNFEEEACEFLRENESFLSKMKLGFEKLFQEDGKNSETIHSERYKEKYTEEYKFIGCLYSVIIGYEYGSNDESVKIPFPFPTISFDYKNDSLCIVIPPTAKEFIDAFQLHNTKLQFIDSANKEPDIHAVFKNPDQLKAFLIACKIPNQKPDFAANKMANDLYSSLQNRYVLTLETLENSSNPEIISLKKLAWTHTVLNDQGEAFARDNCSDLKVNGEVLNPAKQFNSMPGIISECAKQFSLITQYQFTHSQKASYLFEHAVSGSLCKIKSKTDGNLMIVKKNESVNIELTQTSASCITNNSLCIIFDRSHSKCKASLFSIPGHIQTVFEMVGKYQFQAIFSDSQEPIPSDITLQNNPQKLYLYLGEKGLTFAVYDIQTREVKRIVIKNNDLDKENIEKIKVRLKEPSTDQRFDQPENTVAFLPFLELAKKAGYPILGLKLKTICVSNSALRKLVTGDVENWNEETLSKMVSIAKQEESKESLYEWYKLQAVTFANDHFRQNNCMVLNWDDADRQLYAEIEKFIYKRYENPAEKFYQFIDEVQKMIETEERLLADSGSQKVSAQSTRQLPKLPQQLQEAFKLFIKNQANTQYKESFQSAFLHANQALVVKIKKAIAGFLANPQKQFCIFFLERCLSEMAAKIMNDLKSGKGWDMDNFSPVIGAVLEAIIVEIKGLEVQCIQSMNLLLCDWDNEWANEEMMKRLTLPKRTLEILLDQVRLYFPLTQEQSEAHASLTAEIKSKNTQYKLNPLSAEVYDYFNNRLFSNLEKTQTLITHLNEENIAVPLCLSSLVVHTPVIKTRALPLPQPSPTSNPTKSLSKQSSVPQIPSGETKPIPFVFKQKFSDTPPSSGLQQQTGKSPTALVINVRSLPNHPFTPNVSQIDLFLRVVYKAYCGGSNSQIESNARCLEIKLDDNGAIHIMDGATTLAAFLDPVALGIFLTQNKATQTVNMNELYKELCVRCDKDYNIISKKWKESSQHQYQQNK